MNARQIEQRAIEEHEGQLCPEDWGCKEYIAHLTAKLEAAESSRVALRQALQRLLNSSTAVNNETAFAAEGVTPETSLEHELAIVAAEALLAHEPSETT